MDLQVGDQVIWTPVNARRGCYGTEDAKRPLKCEIIGKSVPRGTYFVKIIDRLAVVREKNIFEVVKGSVKKI